MRGLKKFLAVCAIAVMGSSPTTAVVLSSSLATGCASFGTKPPATAGAIGKTSFYISEVNRMLVVIQDVATAADKGNDATPPTGVISRAEYRTIIDATVKAGEANKTLSKALVAGQLAPDGKARAIAEVNSILENIHNNVSPATATLISPYTTTVRALLAILGGLS